MSHDRRDRGFIKHLFVLPNIFLATYLTGFPTYDSLVFVLNWKSEHTHILYLFENKDCIIVYLFGLFFYY